MALRGLIVDGRLGLRWLTICAKRFKEVPAGLKMKTP